MTATKTTTSAASALARMVPTPSPLTAAPSGGAPVGTQVTAAVVATFVGQASADMAVALIDLEAIAATAAGAPVGATDVLRPALEAAAATLGAGVLSEARIEDATAMFTSPDAAVYELTSASGTTAGWFAIRVRQPVEPARPSGDNTVFAGKLSRINDVEMQLTVEIGRTRMPVRDVLSLEPGAVIELDRSAGAPADVLINGRLIAQGEVIVVDQDYAVRITKVLDAEGAN